MNSLVRLFTAPAIELMSMANDTAAVLRREQRYRDVPAVKPSAGLIAEALVDGTFSLGMNLLIGVPESHKVRRGHQELLAMHAFMESNGWFQDPAGYHQSPPPLRAVQRVPKQLSLVRGGTSYVELSFESDYTPHPIEPGRERWLAHEDNGTAAAYVLEHEGLGRPWLVCIHGFGMGQASVTIGGMNARWIHEELGLNVLMPVLPLHGPRSSTHVSGGELLQPEYANIIQLFAQAVWDLRRLLDWLRGRTNAPIGLYGISLGGYTAALASAFIDDLACVVSGIPAVDFTSLARDNEPWTYKAYGGQFRNDWNLLSHVMYPVSPLTFEPRLERSKRYIYAGVADRVARPDQARALWRHWGRPEIEWLASGHVMAMAKSELRPFLRRVAATHLFAPGAAPFATDGERRTAVAG